MKTFVIKTLGCKVNQYESQVIREQLLSAGLKEVSFDIKLADIYVINTCTVTQESDQKSLKYLRDTSKNNKYSAIIATGCLTELDEEELKQFPEIIIVKNNQKHRISELLRLDSKESLCIQDFEGHSRAFIKIQNGCDNFCSYCKVRLVRGKSKSRDFKEIIEEAKALIDRGFQEIVLSGICLGSYGRDISQDLNLCFLLREILKASGRFRVRLSSIEPGDITEELIGLIKTEEKLCKHLHIPFQSGDDKILERMNRPYTSEAYINIVKRIKDAVSDIAITTDIMVGFPGETDKGFENTIKFLEEVRPSRTHIFPFSKRKWTSAYSFSDTVPIKIIKEREKRLFEITNRLSYEYAKNFIGALVKVLVETERDFDATLLKGYTDRYLKIYFEGPDEIKGKLVTCLVTSAGLTNQKTYGILIP